MRRGEVWWAQLDERRAVVLLSGDETSELRGMQVVPPADVDIDGVAVEVRLGAREGLPAGGVVRVALPRAGFIPCVWLVTVGHDDLIERAGVLSPAKLRRLEDMLRVAGLESLFA